jgi:O-antigen ligase
VYYDSFVLAGLARLAAFITKLWNYSTTHRMLQWLGRKVKLVFANSSIFSFLGAGRSSVTVLNESLIYRMFDRIFDLPYILLGGIFYKKRVLFNESVAYVLFKTITDNMHILISLFLFLVLVVPHELWKNVYSTAGVLIFLLLFLIKTITDSKVKLYIKAFDFFLFIFLVSVILAEVFSLYPGLSLRFLVFYLTCFFLLLLLASSINNKGQLADTIEIILIGLTITGLYGILQEIRGVPLNVAQVDLTLNEGMLGRIYSTYYNSNNYAEVLIMLLPFYAAVVFYSKGILKKLLFLALAAPSFTALLLTGSRSSWIGIAVAVLVFALIKNKAIVPMLIIAGILAFPFLPQSIYRRALTLLKPTSDSSIMYRIDIYKTVWPLFKEYWITGLGLGNDVFKQLGQDLFHYTKEAPIHSHNVFFQVWFETGVVGALAYIGYVLGLIKKSVKSIKRITDPIIINVLVAGAASISGILAVSLFEYVWFYQRVMLIFWAVAGLVTAALKLAHADGAEQHTAASPKN